MPLLAINLSDSLFATIKDLVESGNYQTPESFLEIAAFNQLALERGATPAEIIARGHRKLRAEDADGNGKAHQPSATSDFTPQPANPTVARRSTPPVARAALEKVTVTEADYEAAFERLARVRWPDPLLVPAQTPRSRRDDRIFGQVNRLFPLKLACRWLAAATAREGRW